MHKKLLQLVLVLGFAAFYVPIATAVEHQVLEKYVADDVLAVAYVDLTKIDTLGVLDWAELIGLSPKEIRSDLLPVAMQLQGQMDELVDFGVQYVYVLLRVADLQHGGPTWVVPVAKTGNAETVRRLILADNADELPSSLISHVPGVPVHWEVVDGTLVGGNTTEQLSFMKESLPTAPRDYRDAWESLGQGDCGLVVIGDDDSRRVLREMFPALPKPFEKLTGKLLADGLPWAGISLGLPPDLNMEVVIAGQDQEIAGTIANTVTESTAVLKLFALTKLGIAQEHQESFLKSVVPQVDGNQVRIDIEDALGDAEQLANLFSKPIVAARQQFHHNNRSNQFKNIALAVHNYADREKGTFPAAASYDDNGKPLLSWRVHILPELDLGALYQQFHLDEPWDSEHNRKLIEKMPAIYADPDPALRKINRKGQTTFVVPVGNGTMFDSEQGHTFKDNTDGTSNTILFVEVVPEQAVVWTKPDDWEVNFDKPLDGLRREDREGFSAARCDGSVHVIPNDVEEWKVRAWLTRAGGEIVN